MPVIAANVASQLVTRSSGSVVRMPIRRLIAGDVAVGASVAVLVPSVAPGSCVRGSAVERFRMLQQIGHSCRVSLTPLRVAVRDRTDLAQPIEELTATIECSRFACVMSLICLALFWPDRLEASSSRAPVP